MYVRVIIQMSKEKKEHTGRVLLECVWSSEVKEIKEKKLYSNRNSIQYHRSFVGSVFSNFLPLLLQ